MMQRRVNLYLIIALSLVFQFQCYGQGDKTNSVTLSTEEGSYSITFVNEDLVETTFTSEDSINIQNEEVDSLLINLGTASEDIHLRTVPVSDTLKITLRGLEMNVSREPFRINYDFDGVWYDWTSGKKFLPGSTIKVTHKDSLISKLARGGALIPSVKTEREELWQVHYLFEEEEKAKEQVFCSEDFNVPEGEDCIEVSYEILENEIIFSVNSASSAPTLDELELILHGLENRIEFVWLNNIKYTAKNFLHEGKQIIPLRFDSPKNDIRIELK